MGDRKLDEYTATGIAEGWIDADEGETLGAWQYLVDTGLCWQLQGWFGRTAQALIDEGTISGPAHREHATLH